MILFLKGLNFTALDPSVSFYMFSLYFFHDECNESTKLDLNPISGSRSCTLVRYILCLVVIKTKNLNRNVFQENLKLSIESLKIPNNKIYYNFALTAITSNTDAYFCDITYDKVCTKHF